MRILVRCSPGTDGSGGQRNPQAQRRQVALVLHLLLSFCVFMGISCTCLNKTRIFTSFLTILSKPIVPRQLFSPEIRQRGLLIAVKIYLPLLLCQYVADGKVLQNVLIDIASLNPPYHCGPNSAGHFSRPIGQIHWQLFRYSRRTAEWWPEWRNPTLDHQQRFFCKIAGCSWRKSAGTVPSPSRWHLFP